MNSVFCKNNVEKKMNSIACIGKKYLQLQKTGREKEKIERE